MDPLDQLYAHPELSLYGVPFSPALFHLGLRVTGNYRPISIPHQIVLGNLFVKQAAAYQVLGKNDPLLIFGAGAAGISAAITAAELGIPVTIREQGDLLFGPQNRSKTRWLHPHQYDWPAPHWEEPEFPRTGTVPLPWTANFAHEIAADWTKLFDAARARFPKLITFEHSRGAYVPPAPPKNWQTLSDNAAKDLYTRRYEAFRENEDPDLDFNLYLICTGFGKENCSIPTYCGFPFWSTDYLYDAGYKTAAESPHVLFSGGGDGAHQDLLRIAFMEQPVVLLGIIRDNIATTQSGHRWWAHVAPAVTRIEKDTSVDLGKVAKDYAQLVDEIPADVWTRIASQIEKLLRKEFHRVTVTFAFSGPYPPRMFALNRFLVLLLRRYLKEKTNRDIFRPNTKFSETCQAVFPHVCNGDPRICHGHPHRVTVEANPSASTEEYDILVIRHGPKPSPHDAK